LREFVICDLDGTVTRRDTSVVLLEKFAPGRYEHLEELYHKGECSLKETSLEEFRLLRQPRAVLEAYVRENTDFDPDFPRFVALCRKKGIGVAIASEGLDFYIETILDMMGLAGLEYYGDLAAFGETLLEDVFFPHWNPDCGKCGTCKVKIIQEHQERGDKVTFIGEGRTDRHAAHVADGVFAKGVLLDYCRENGIECESYEGFREIIGKMGLEGGDAD
jgi:2-hydroxy-3-keto-5-methylthiopentenyl-1-phosphate phosphatase